jgi:putative heme-binding domain-containing protein
MFCIRTLAKESAVWVTMLAIVSETGTASAAQPNPEPPPNTIALEALSRLKGIDLETSPAVKAAVMRVIESTAGTPQFVELVREFRIKDQNPALLALALNNVTNATGVDAVRLILENTGTDLLKQSLNSADPAVALRTVKLLGNVPDKQVVPMLESVVTDDKRDGLLRKESVRAMAQTQEGALTLISLAKNDRLGSDLKLLAAAELSRAPWPNVKSIANEILPLPQSQNAEPLPPIAELIKRSGSSKRGEEIFARATVACINCHQVNGKGVEFGPNLSEIGTKLGKDALYESILDPNSGISFGYEAWEVTFKNGDETFGLLASETAEEISIKTQNGIVTRYKKSDLAKREQKKSSIMPTGLQQAMTTQELVDLIEYLSSLKKPSATN